MSNIKEPYEISVWEEELVPVQDWYVQGDERLTKEEFEAAENKEGYELHTVMEHYEETQGIVIGAHDMNSVYAAINPILKKNVNGNVELTFGLYQKPFDPDAQEFLINPFTSMLANETKIKLKFRNKWYDFIVKSRVEDSTNFMFNYTCKALYINELNKNGFKVELDSELENNQDSVTGLAETILLDTDWQVDKENSDIIVETKIEPLYIGTLNQAVVIKKINDYVPDEYADMEGQWVFTEIGGKKEPVQSLTLEEGSKVLFFYSDIAENVKQPQFLARICPIKNNNNEVIGYTTYDPEDQYLRSQYLTDANEDIIINAYNYQIISPEVYYVDSEIEFNIPSIVEEALEIYDWARGEKVIKSQRSGYDPDLDKFIFKFYRKDDTNHLVEYYGYSETQILRTDLAQNYLANSDNFTSLTAGWYFDGVPATTVKSKGKVKTAAYSGQIFTKTEETITENNMNTGSENVLVLQLKPETEGDYYLDIQGEYYLTLEPTYVKKTSSPGMAFEESIKKAIKYENGLDEDEDINDEALLEKVVETLMMYSYSYNNNSKSYYHDSEKGNFYQVTPPEYNLTSSSSGKAYEDNIRTFIYDQRDNGIDGYVDKTDDELDDIINEILIKGRYSVRNRYAINTGVAANRQKIGQLTPGEEYLFAVSLGKFKNNEEGPQYGAEIKYGAKVPSEFYEFSEADEHNIFIQRATERAAAEVDEGLSKDAYKYYLDHPEYNKVYTSAYNRECKASEREYEKNFLFGLNTVNSDAKDNWRSGGKKYRELFLQYLRGHDDSNRDKTFFYEGKNIKICEYIAERIWTYYSDPAIDRLAYTLYSIFISGREYVRNPNDPEIGQWYYQGMYPTMVLNTVIEAKAEQDKTILDYKWEPMGYDEAQFPVFDEISQDVAATMTSFNESLFDAFYRGLKDAYLKPKLNENTYIWNNDVLDKWKLNRDTSEEIIAYGAAEIESLLKTLYKTAYEEGKFLKVYNQAKEYKMPCSQFPEGGAIYREYKKRWEKDAKTVATQEANDAVSVNILFAKPTAIQKIQEDKEEANEQYYTTIKNLTKFIEDKENGLRSEYSFDQIGKDAYNRDYKDLLPDWIQEFLNDSNIANNNGQYYYVNFIPLFLKYWVAEQEIGTYVLAEDKYELNGGKLQEVTDSNKLSTPIWQPSKITSKNAKHFEQGLFITGPTNAKYVAIKTNYNPYLNTNAGTAGGYVFDRNEEIIRLFDPSRDMLGATYEPIKDDDGEYIFDVFEQVYRPFRNWSTEQKLHPITFEEDEELGVYGDVTNHPIKAFDGHIGSWTEEPTRYRMVRQREDPEKTLNPDQTLKYVYLPQKTSFNEVGYYKGKTYEYVNTYPAGYQTDSYIQDNRGKYVKATDVKMPKRPNIFLKLFGEDALWELHGATSEEVQTVAQVTEKKTFWSKLKDWFTPDNKFKVNDTEYDDNFKEIANQEESGLLISNTQNSDSNIYNEDRTSVSLRSVTIGEQTYTLSSPKIDDIENEAETKNALDKNLVTIEEKENIQDTIPDAIRYIKYKPWYWRHWRAGTIDIRTKTNKRYNYQPKICVQKNINGVTVYKPFNNIEDSVSEDYRIEKYDSTKSPALGEGEVLAFYLKDSVKKYRSAREIDYGTRKYRMILQNKKSKKFWVESPDGEAYLRHYKLGDGEIKLWDGHFGKWIDCFAEELVSADETFVGWDSDDAYPGLKVLYARDENDQIIMKDDKPVISKVALPEFYLPYNGMMIPWDARVLNRDEKYTRQRVPFDAEKEDALYVYSDGIYCSLSDYYNDNGFSNKLKYDNLKVSFISDFKYDASTFSIKNLPQNRDEYLSFDLNTTPSGTIDLIVSENTLTEEVVKERWIYWKASVKKEFSLTKDILQPVGILFETTRNVRGEVTSYPFLGMQLFQYIPYEKKATKLNKHLLSPKKDEELIKKMYKALHYWQPERGQEEEFKEDLEVETNAFFDKWFNEYETESDESWTDQDFLKKVHCERYRKLLEKAYNKSFGYDIEDRKKTPLYDSYVWTVIPRLEADQLKNSFISKVFAEHNIEYMLYPEKENNRKVELNVLEEQPITIPLFPGEAPDAKDFIRLLYYIYDPEKVTDVEDVVYAYVGTNPFEQFEPSYDEQCQKIRSIKGKESNYFKLLQDCCDTFDCWIEPIVDHDDDGRVKYVEKTIYTQNNTEQGEEPQIYVGDDAKQAAIDNKILWYEKRFGYNSAAGADNTNARITKQKTVFTYTDPETGDQKEDDSKIVSIVYTEKEGLNPPLTVEQKLELQELNRLAELSLNLTRQYMLVPDKKIRFKRYVGRENWNGFKYGVNLKHIKRTIDSNQISTRVIVKPNKNEHATDNFCTIQRAHDNPIKENFLYDFSYYTQNNLLNSSSLTGDLYTGVNTKLNYYNKLIRLNKDNDAIIQELSQLTIDLDNIKAKYETAVLARDAAAEEIQKLALILTSNYDTYGQIIDNPWSFKKSQEFETRKQTSSPEIEFNTQIEMENGETLNITIDVPKTGTAVDYPKYNDSLRTTLDQMDTFQIEYINNEKLIEKLLLDKERIEKRIQELLKQEEIIANKKNELNKLFYHKYSRFIQEGSWVDENYIDDNLYYLDALSVLRTSCKPKITYDIGVIDIAAAQEYEEDQAVLESELGDRTYVEDVEFFGYQKDKITPYWEMVVVSEKTYNLDDPSQNQTKVKNYSTQFDDLFQRIAATSQTLQFNEGSYSRAAAIVTDEGTLNAELLQKTIASSDFIISNSITEEVTWDNTGITVISTTDRSNVVKIVSRGILISNDGGNKYKTAITGDGLNADLLTAGRIDTKMLLIGNSNKPNFFWNELGISAFRSENENIDYSSFVRLDQFGIYGIQNYDNPEDKTKLSFNNSFAPRSVKEIANNPNAVFGLTWDGFFLNASNGTGRVLIGTEQDFKMSEYSVSQNLWLDKVIIGRLQDQNGNEYYGFRLKNEENQIVMETNETGELYLKRKLRISNFNDMEAYYPFQYVENGEEVEINVNGVVITEPVLDEDGNPTVDNEGNVIMAPVRSLRTYYYSYVEENGRKKKKYYTEDWVLFRIEDTDIDWRNSISNPQDRVTLGIVDTYLRNYIDDAGVSKRFRKEDVLGLYSSSDYLTKVMSIKVNGFVGSEPFDVAGEEISRLIEDNETFAIFDNGNLYAKNAWVEGHIRADSGAILGTLEVGQEGGTGVIKHANNEWLISGDGTAYFKNVNVSGVISSATFEYDQVQTVGGTMLICPTVIVKKVERFEEKVTEERTALRYHIYLDMTKLPEEIQGTNNYFVIMNKNGSFDSENEPSFLFTLPQNQGTEVVSDTIEGNTVENPYIIVNFESDQTYDIRIDDLKEGSALLLLSNEERTKGSKTGIVINSSKGQNGFPKQSISIIDIYKPTGTPKALLGYLDTSLFVGSQMQNLMKESYGLYCDNVYIKGSLISEEGSTLAGVTTSNAIKINLPNTENGTEKITYAVLFAGSTLDQQNLSFYVTKEGYLYAENGYFRGDIEASTLKACKIIGNQDGTYALEIDGYNSDYGLVFRDSDGGVGESQRTFLELQKQGAFFYNRLIEGEFSNTQKSLFSIFHKKEETDETLGIGLFGETQAKSMFLSDFLLNFTSSTAQVQLNYKTKPVATIDENGFRIVGGGGGIGDAKVENIYDGNTFLGVDIII